MKRSPLNRGNKPLKAKKQLQAKTPLKSKKKIPPRSKKAQKLYKEKRIPLVEKLLGDRPWCEACGKFAELDGKTFFRVAPSRDLHEIKSRGRTGGIHSDEWLDEDNILCVCRPCHQRITADKDGEATKLGLLKPRSS
jgi:hypothetical protein